MNIKPPLYFGHAYWLKSPQGARNLASGFKEVDSLDGSIQGVQQIRLPEAVGDLVLTGRDATAAKKVLQAHSFVSAAFRMLGLLGFEPEITDARAHKQLCQFILDKALQAFPLDYDPNSYWHPPYTLHTKTLPHLQNLEDAILRATNGAIGEGFYEQAKSAQLPQAPPEITQVLSEVFPFPIKPFANRFTA